MSNPAEHKLFKEYFDVIPGVMQKTKRDEKNKKFVWKQSPSDYEKYSTDVMRCVAHLISLHERLKQIPVFFEHFPKVKVYTKLDINIQKHFLYHIENFYTRLVGLGDRMLIILNEVFELGFSEKDLKYNVILRMNQIKGTKIAALFRRMEKMNQKKRSIRNRILHVDEYSDEQLMNIELFTIISERPTMVDEGFLKDIRQLLKQETKIYKKEQLEIMKKEIVQAESVTNEFFDLIYPIFKKRARSRAGFLDYHSKDNE